MHRYGASPMTKILPLSVVSLCAFAVSATAAQVEVNNSPKPKFSYTDNAGKDVSVEVVTQYQPKKLTRPVTSDSSVNPKLRRAATLAQERARAHSRSLCWRYVKQALVAAGVVESYPKTALAKQAGQELVGSYGFKRLPVKDPYKAPVGSVLVYGAKKAAGHVEIRTKQGFVSDFQSKTPSPRPLIGVYAKS